MPLRPRYRQQIQPVKGKRSVAFGRSEACQETNVRGTTCL